MSEPFIRYVLESRLTLHSSQKFQMKLKWEREQPQMNLRQMATLKVAPKIPFAILKSLINECDHISSDVVSNTCSWIFQIFKQEHGIK